MKKVLIVDDDPTVGSLFKAKLEGTGRFEVVVANGGRAGVRMAESEQPDIVVCDIDMPDMDGVSVGAAMEERASTRNIPLIFLSSLVTPKDVHRGTTAGKWPMMSKQSPVLELIERIDYSLRGPGMIG